VAATNQDLERDVREGRFREDLFYRLNVIPIALPSLHERRTDIPLLVEHFLAKHGASGRRSVSQEALAMLVAYDWPGNVRELESVIERALLLGEGDVIVPADLPASVRARHESAAGAMPGVEIPDEGIDLDALEESLLLKALDKAGGNVSRAARLLGLSRRTMQYRMGKLQGTAAGTGTANGPDDD
jgi:DNA-binding NtrC family response regulator